MDMDRDNLTTNTTTTETTGNTRVYDTPARSGSNFLAYLIGGLVIAVGLLAFLFYDGGSTNDVNTTGSTTTTQGTSGSVGTRGPAEPAPPALPRPAPQQ